MQPIEMWIRPGRPSRKPRRKIYILMKRTSGESSSAAGPALLPRSSNWRAASVL